MSAEKKHPGVDLGLSDREKEELLRIARTVIEKKSRGEPAPSFSALTERLGEKFGAFVSLYKKGMLRGCIGSVDPEKPLWKTVAEMAEAAGFRDPRFMPITEDELPYIELEVSVLTPLEELQDTEKLEVGRHGLMITEGSRSGLLLPQVAAERNWDRITFLQETCRKAGLPRDAWKDKDAKLFVFAADVF